MAWEVENETTPTSTEGNWEAGPIAPTGPTNFSSKVAQTADNIISPVIDTVYSAYDTVTREGRVKKEIATIKHNQMTEPERAAASQVQLMKEVEKKDKEAKAYAKELATGPDPVEEGEAMQLGVELAGLQVVKPFMEVASYMSKDSATMNNTIGQYLRETDSRLKSERTKSAPYAIAKSIEFLPQVAAGWLTKASTPTLLLTEFLMGASYESTTVYPDEQEPGKFRNAGLSDMFQAGAFNTVLAGFGATAAQGYKNYKESGGIIPMFSSENVKDILTTNADNLLDMVDVVKLKAMGIPLDNYLVAQGGAVVGEAGTNAKAVNVWENRAAAKRFYGINKKLQQLSSDAIDKLHKVQGPIDVMDWKQLNGLQTKVDEQVGSLSNAYTKIVNEAYTGAEASLKSVDHIKIDAGTLVDSIDEVYKTSPTSVRTAIEPLLNKTATKLGMNPKQVSSFNAKYDDAFSTLQSSRANYSHAVTPFEKKKTAAAMKRAQKNYDTLAPRKKRLDKAKYEFNLGELESLRKLINHKIYVPGQNVSMSDRMALQSLQTIKSKLDETMTEATSGSKELFEASLPLMQARELATSKAEKFGLGADNTFMTDLIIKGDKAAISRVLTNPVEGPKALKFIGDSMGKDSEAYTAASRLYIEGKMTGLQTVSVGEATGDTSKAFSGSMADPAQFAAAYNKLTNADIKMIRGTYGDDVASRINGLKKFSASYASHIKFLQDKEVPVGFHEIIKTSPMTAIFDAVAYYGKQVINASIAGAPVTRMFTGAATGGAMEAASNDDLTMEGLVTSMAAGAIAGHYGGRVIRSILEPDVKKVVRYIEQGKHIKAQDALKQLQKTIDDQGGSYINKDATLASVIQKEAKKKRSTQDAVDYVTYEGAKMAGGAAVGATAMVASDRNATKSQVIGAGIMGAGATKAPSAVRKLMK